MSLPLHMSFGKMCVDYPRRPEGTICEESSMGWQSAVISEPAGYSTLSTSNWPSVEEGGSACSLAEILEPDAPAKYYLSARACAGILRRAEKRGKELPEHLKAALQAVVSQEQMGPVPIT